MTDIITYNLQQASALSLRLANGDLEAPVTRAIRALVQLNNAVGHSWMSYLLLAKIKFPESKDEAEALGLLAAEWETLACDLDTAATATDGLCASDGAALRWHIDVAVNRSLAIEQDLQRVASQLQFRQIDLDAKREKMRKAGVPEEDIERLVPDVDTPALEAEREALQGEQVQIQRFLKTANPIDLPEGFDERVAAAKAAYEVRRPQAA